MVNKKIVALATGLVIGVIFFLILPVSSQKIIQLSECTSLTTSGPCAPQTIPSSQKPLIVTLTDSQELLAANSSNEISRNVLISVLIGTGYYLATTKQIHNSKKKKKVVKQKPII